jgi:protein tyrosine/serine phosphatase
MLLLILLIPLFTSCGTAKEIFCAYDTFNFHAVKEGVLYRSAQPSAADLRLVVRDYSIQSVINLRGAQIGQSWYDIEKRVSDELRLQRVDIAMSAARLPHREDLILLLDAFRVLPRPILIHCKAGADRTGEAAAIFAIDHLGWSREDALRQLRPYYGHVCKLTPAKKYFIREVYQGEDWARNTFDPCKQDYEYYDKAECNVDVKARRYSPEVDDER